MDVDSDIDGQLMQQFLSMGTQDREVLVSEFQKLLGNQLNPSACAFFLDMNNWNLQAAICSYYDFEQPSSLQLPSMMLVKDITIGEGEAVSPDVNFVKTWRIKNSGTSVWPPGCALKFFLGHQLGCTERVMVDALAPGTEIDISVHMRSPKTPGIYEGQWRMSTATGSLFGDTIWVILQVCENGLLDLAQGMSQIGNSELGMKIHKDAELDTIYNPFSSPVRRIGLSLREPSPATASHSDSHIYSSSHSNSNNNIGSTSHQQAEESSSASHTFTSTVHPSLLPNSSGDALALQSNISPTINHQSSALADEDDMM